MLEFNCFIAIALLFFVCDVRSHGQECDPEFDKTTAQCYKDLEKIQGDASICYIQKQCDNKTHCEMMNNSTVPFLHCLYNQTQKHPECAGVAYKTAQGAYATYTAPSFLLPTCNISWPTCNTTWVQAMRSCVQTYGAEISNITNTTAPGDFPGKCRLFDNATVNARRCVADIVTMDYFCSNDAKVFEHSINMHAQKISEMCDNCSALRVANCFLLMPAPNGTDIQAHICNSTAMIKQCLEPSYQNCNKTDIDKILEPTGLHEMDEVCKPSCQGMVAKHVTMMQCIAMIPNVTVYNYNNVCSYVNAVFRCLSQSAGKCHYLIDHLSPQLNTLYPIMASYQCNITDGSNTYSARGCGLRKMTECFNPVFSKFSQFNLKQIPDLKMMTQTINSWQVALFISSNRTDFCGKAMSGLASSKQCAMTEYNKCSHDMFMSDIKGLDPWANWRQAIPTVVQPSTGRIQLPRLTQMIQPPYTLYNNLTFQNLMSAATTFTAANTKLHTIDMSCNSACVNQSVRVSAYEGCIKGLGLNLNNIASYMEGIIQKFDNNQSFSAECSKVSSLVTCTDAHMKGCPMTEQQVSSVLGGTVVYTALSLCNKKVGFTLRLSPGACDNPRFVQNELSYIPKRCGPTTLTEADLKAHLSKEKICSSLQTQIHCYVQNSKCCESRQQLLEPMRHTWGFFNQKMGCNLQLQEQMDVHKIMIKPLEPASGSCDYSEVLKCYGPLLKKVGLDSNSQVNWTSHDLQNMVKLKNTIMQHPMKCLTDSEFTNIEKCVKVFTDRCKYPATCGLVSNHTPKDVWTAMPLADILGLADVRNLCTKDCKDMKFDMSSFDKCEVGDFTKQSRNVVWMKITGQDTSMHCGKIRKIMNCISPKLQHCGALVRHFNKAIDMYNQVQSEALQLCAVSLPSDQPPTARPTTAPNGAPGQGAGFVMVMVMAYICTLVYSYII